jgi:hypothetical protein
MTEMDKLNITAIEINGTRYTPYDIGECADCVQCDLYELCTDRSICDLILNEGQVWKR